MLTCRFDCVAVVLGGFTAPTNPPVYKNVRTYLGLDVCTGICRYRYRYMYMYMCMCAYVHIMQYYYSANTTNTNNSKKKHHLESRMWRGFKT